MELFGSFTSPYVRHCRITAEALDLPVKLVESDYSASAKNSPAMRVPFFRDGDVLLTDSSSIIKYFCDKREREFLTTAKGFDQFAAINTAMDSCINLFLLERDGLTPDNTAYLKRQDMRVKTLLTEMNEWDGLDQIDSFEDMDQIQVRLACFINWALYRNRIDISKLERLKAFDQLISTFEQFDRTHPSKT